MSVQDEQGILRSVKRLYKQEGYFTSRRIQADSGIDSNVVSNRTVRSLNQHSILYLQSCKKGLLGEQDLADRIKFCRKLRRKKLGAEFWKEGLKIGCVAKGKKKVQ